MGFVSDENFSHIRVHKTVKEKYLDLSNKYKLYNRKGVVKDYLLELLIKAEKELDQQHHHAVRVHSGLHSADMGDLHAKVIDEITNRYCLNDLDQQGKENLCIPLKNFRLIIQRLFNIRNERTINREKDKILEFLNLKQIREGNIHIVVLPEYKTKSEDLIQKDIEEEIIGSLINRIKTRQEGLGDLIVYKELQNDKKVINQFLNKIKVNGIIKHGTDFVLKSIVQEKNKQQAAAEADSILGALSK